MIELYKKLERAAGSAPPRLPVPRIVTIFSKCAEYGIQDGVIKRLHFNDLQVLIYSLDIQNIRQQLKNAAKMKSGSKQQPRVIDISQEEAAKFLKRGL